MSLARYRICYLPALLASLAILSATFVLENSLGLAPCSLCYSQRLLLALYAMVCLCAVVHAPSGLGWRTYARLTLACSAGGALLAARHVWLQGSGMPIETCPAPIGGLFEHSWSQGLKTFLLGGPDCGSLTWSFLDLTLPEWSLLAFLLLAALPLSRLLAYRFRTLNTL